MMIISKQPLIPGIEVYCALLSIGFCGLSSMVRIAVLASMSLRIEEIAAFR